jgi:hypothetical protein
MMFPSNRNRQAWWGAAKAEARAMFTDAKVAADSLWNITQMLYSTAMFYRSVWGHSMRI